MNRGAIEPVSPNRLRWWLGFAGFAAVAGYFLWTGHRAHVDVVLPYLPWLLVLACPLIHLFMHSGHGGHSHGPDSGPRKEE